MEPNGPVNGTGEAERPRKKQGAHRPSPGNRRRGAPFFRTRTTGTETTDALSCPQLRPAGLTYANHPVAPGTDGRFVLEHLTGRRHPPPMYPRPLSRGRLTGAAMKRQGHEAPGKYRKGSSLWRAPYSPPAIQPAPAGRDRPNRRGMEDCRDAQARRRHKPDGDKGRPPGKAGRDRRDGVARAEEIIAGGPSRLPFLLRRTKENQAGENRPARPVTSAGEPSPDAANLAARPKKDAPPDPTRSGGAVCDWAPP